MAGRQCMKKMYLDRHHREWATPPTAAQQALFKFGHEFGECTHDRFPGGVLVPVHLDDPNAALDSTQSLVANRGVSAIFEAAFLFDDLFVRVDILERQPDGSWHLIECKSTTSAKEVHRWDVALQAYVVQGCGMNVHRYSVMHINRGYRHGSVLSPDRFLRITDVSSDIQGLSKEIPKQVQIMKPVLRAPHPPSVEPGAHCWQPYPCEFWTHCTNNKPAQWVGRLPDGERQIPKLVARGVRTFDQIPLGFSLSTMQQHAVQQKEWRSPHLPTVMKRLPYPIHYLHVETAWYGIPLFSGMKPYERVPFQWSMLRESEGGVVNWEDWVDLGRDRAPVLAFLESLVGRLGTKGAIVVYSGAVLGTLKSLRQRLPRDSPHKPLVKELIYRCVDVREIIRSKYYDPRIHYGVYDAIPRRDTSIKHIVEVLPDRHCYELLSTLDVEWASRTYRNIVRQGKPESVEHFREQVQARSHQAVRALYAVRQLLTVPAASTRLSKVRTHGIR